MIPSFTYWEPTCRLRSELQLWARFAVDDGSKRWVGSWGMLLIMPVEGYLETAGGPVLLRTIEWVQIALEKPAGGRKGIPLQFRDVSDEVVARLRQLPVTWELRDATWAREDLFEERPVRVVHLPNPYWTGAAQLPHSPSSGNDAG